MRSLLVPASSASRCGISPLEDCGPSKFCDLGLSELPPVSLSVSLASGCEGAFAPGARSDIGSLVLDELEVGFIPCFEDLVADFSLLERLVLLGRRECEEDGLSRGDFGFEGGMPSPLETPLAISGSCYCSSAS